MGAGEREEREEGGVRGGGGGAHKDARKKSVDLAPLGGTEIKEDHDHACVLRMVVVFVVVVYLVAV